MKSFIILFLFWDRTYKRKIKFITRFFNKRIFTGKTTMNGQPLIKQHYDLCKVHQVWFAISALKLKAVLLCLGLGLAQLIKPFQVTLTLTLHSCRRLSSRHSPFPLTECSARVCPKVHFELTQTQFLLRVSTPSSLYVFPWHYSS